MGRTRSGPRSAANDFHDGSISIERSLPPRDLWPDVLYRGAGLDYPEQINVADRLLNHPGGPSSHATAIIFRNERVSYEALRHRVLSIAAMLIRLGVNPMDRVALRLPNCPDFVATWLAIQWIGAICVHMPPQYRRREIEYIVNHSGASVIVCAAGLAGDVRAAQERFETPVAVVGCGATTQPHEAPPYPIDRNQPAAITYIAAADGPLRGVVHSPADILAAADTYACEVLQLTSTDVCIGAISLAWAFGLGALLAFPLRVGATTALVDGPAPLIPAIADSTATVLFGVPTMYRMLLRQPSFAASDLGSLRCCVSAGEPLPPEVLEEWRDRTGLDILDGLGTTELTHIFISARPGMVRPGLIGTPVAGYEARVVDDDMRTVPEGTPGRLAVRGPTGARYWRDTEAQRRAVRGGWTLTGDICIRHADGWFRHIRRSDTLIVSAGQKISIREVERALEENPDVSSARVFSVPDPVRGAVAHATVIPVEGTDTSTLAERLKLYLKTELASFKCPRDIRIG
jgi:2-aminobenzoate-CoA ligase